MNQNFYNLDEKTRESLLDLITVLEQELLLKEKKYEEIPKKKEYFKKGEYGAFDLYLPKQKEIKDIAEFQISRQNGKNIICVINSSEYKENLGKQVCADMYFENEINYKQMPGLIYKAAKISKATPLNMTFYDKKEGKTHNIVFSDAKPAHPSLTSVDESFDFSAAMLVSESHFALHVKGKRAVCDAYTCGNEAIALLGYLFIDWVLEPTISNCRYITRGNGVK